MLISPNFYKVPSFLWLLILSGCHVLHAQSRIDPKTVAIYDSSSRKSSMLEGENAQQTCFDEKPFTDSMRGAVNLDCATFPDNKTHTAYTLAINGSATAGDDEKKLEDKKIYYRNRLGSLLMKHSDDVCIASLGRAANNDAVGNFLLNFLTTAFSSASAIVSGETAKSILAGSAALTSGTKDHFNAAFFRNSVVSAVTKAIRTERDKISLEIDNKITSDTKNYTVDTMIRDVNRYHQACSYIRGLELVIQAVQKDELTTADRVNSVEEAIKSVQNGLSILEGQKIAQDDERRVKLLDRLVSLINLKTSLSSNLSNVATVKTVAPVVSDTNVPDTTGLGVDPSPE